jgi:hypothetical protein
MLGYSAYNWFLPSSTMLFELQTICVALNDVGIDLMNRRGVYLKKKKYQNSNLKIGPPWGFCYVIIPNVQLLHNKPQGCGASGA